MPERNQHNTAVKIPDHAIDLGNTPIEFKARRGRKNLGTLKVAKARVEWWEPNGRVAARRMTWDDFIARVKGD